MPVEITEPLFFVGEEEHYRRKERSRTFLILLDKHCSMTQIPGITTKRNAAGKVTHITIDVEQQKELAQPVLKQLEETGEDDFDTAFANGHTIEESEVIVVNEIQEKYASQRESKHENSLSLEESLQSTLHFIDQLFDAKGKNLFKLLAKN